MAKPTNRREQRNRYIAAAAALYLGSLFVGAHIGAVAAGEDAFSVIAAMEHLTTAPLDIFPLRWEAIRMAAVLGLIPPMLLYTEYLRKRDLRPGQEKGSAHWNEDKKAFYKKYSEVRSKLPDSLTGTMAKLTSVPVLGWILGLFWKPVVKGTLALDERPGGKNMIFSDDIMMSMDARKTRRNNNVIVFGGSGTGKSRFFVKPNALQANCSYVFTDPSGELLETLGQFFIDQGYELKVFNLSQMEHSNCYNPFRYIRNQEGVLTMVNAVIQNTTPKGSSKGDPFWEKAETALLEACCFYLMEMVVPEERNFANVMRLLRCASAVEGQEDVQSPLDVMFEDLKKMNPESIACQQYAVFKSAGGGKTAQSILISCQTRLQHFNLDAVKRLTSTDDIDLGTVGDKKTALFCIIPVADTSFNFLVSLLYTQLFETLYYHAENDKETCPSLRLPVHVRFMLDEFANIGTIPEFDTKLATMRKYEISCSIILQALSQLKARYKDEWEVLIGNCDSFLFIGGSDETTLKYVSNKLGKETIRSINNSKSIGRSSSSSMSYNKDGRELMTQDELSTMDNENCVLFVRGEQPFFSRKYRLERHPNYKRSGDAKKELLYDVRERLHTGEASAVSPVDDGLDGKARRAADAARAAMAAKGPTEDAEPKRPALVTAKGKPCLEVMENRKVPDDDGAEKAAAQFADLKELLASTSDIYVHVPSDPDRQAAYFAELMGYMDDEDL